MHFLLLLLLLAPQFLSKSLLDLLLLLVRSREILFHLSPLFFFLPAEAVFLLLQEPLLLLDFSELAFLLFDLCRLLYKLVWLHHLSLLFFLFLLLSHLLRVGDLSLQSCFDFVTFELGRRKVLNRLALLYFERRFLLLR